MKNPLKQMKQVQGAMAVMMYEIYLAGHEQGKKAPLNKLPTLKEFSKDVKQTHKRGKELAKELILHGKGNNPVPDAEESP